VTVNGKKFNVALISVWLAGLSFAGAAVAAWVEAKEDIKANVTLNAQQDRDIGRIEKRLDGRLDSMESKLDSMESKLNEALLLLQRER
jgi:hypothetical protein